MDKQTIIRNFSRYALFYDKYADIQRQTARELAGELKNNGFRKILELGCGTGNYTLILRDKFKDAKLTALDISKKMLEVAGEKLKDKEIEFIYADAENIDLNENFDLITSNACFQWFTDLERSLEKFKELLNMGGLILFSTFGPFTFWELNASLKCALKDTAIHSANFLTKARLTKILKKNFKEYGIKEIRQEESFLTLQDLLNKIKYSGIRGNGLGKRVYFKRKFFQQIQDAYLERFGAIRATYQIFLARGIK